MTLRSCFVACMFFITLVFSAKGQSVINIETKRLSIDTVGWAGSAALGFILNKYQEQQLSLYTNAHVQHKHWKDWHLLYGSFRTVRGGDEDFVNDGFVHFRYNREITSRFRWELFGQWQFNKILNVEERILAGTGPRITAVENEKFKCYLASLYMFEYEEQSPPETSFQRNHRLSMYLHADYEIADDFDFFTTVYYQPLLDQFSDYRIPLQAQLDFEFIENLSFFARFSFLFDNFPAANTPKEVYTIANGIKYEF